MLAQQHVFVLDLQMQYWSSTMLPQTAAIHTKNVIMTQNSTDSSLERSEKQGTADIFNQQLQLNT